MAKPGARTPRRSPWDRPLRLMSRLGRHDAALLVGLALVAGAAWVFLAIADEVTDGDTHAIDERILLAMRTPGDPTDPLGAHWVEEVGRDLTALGSNVILALVTVAVCVHLILLRRLRTAGFVAAAVVSGTLLSFALKNAFDRPRPDLVPHGTYVYTASFPSGHAMLSALTYLTLAAVLARAQPRRRLKACVLLTAILVTVLVGVSRVYLGVHWPTDVLAGWTVGAGWAALCWVAATWLQRRGAVEPETSPDIHEDDSQITS